MMKERTSINTNDTEPEKSIDRRTFISFSAFFAMQALGLAGWKWIYSQPLDGGILGGIQEPLRKVLEGNEKIFTRFFGSSVLAEQFGKSNAVKNFRVNGEIGLSEELFDPHSWVLQINRTKGDPLKISLDAIKKLPKTELCFNFKCIEGWSEIGWWGGVRFADFMKYYSLAHEATCKYAGMSTPDEEYYIGIDMPALLHPQTILCYELNGQPLPLNHGYPLRLITTVKYGIKNLKRISTIFFSNDKPADYWAERGYDYYAGL
jgi:hypothetical protein